MTFSREDNEDPLTESVTTFWKIDTSGTENEDQISLSKNDQRAVEILNNTVRHTGERYKIGLLWREKVTLANNYPVAKAQAQNPWQKTQERQSIERCGSENTRNWPWKKICQISDFQWRYTRSRLVSTTPSCYQPQQTGKGAPCLKRCINIPKKFTE